MRVRLREADDPSDESVVLPVRSPLISRLDRRVEGVFVGKGHVRQFRNVETESPKPRGRDRNEQGFLGSDLTAEILQSTFDKISAGESRESPRL
ncbi:hypothetical protein BH11ARM2_BH11ARM2_00130 [soil metagenome]